MINSTNGSGHHQRPQSPTEKRQKYPYSTGTNADLNGENSARFGTDDQQNASKFSNGIGGLFKRLSPKYRSRSKSPASAHGQQRTEKTWVTVEIKDYQHAPLGAGMANYAPPATSSSSSHSSPSSPILRNGGSSPTTPDKSPRSRGAWGNLFHRGSMKKPRDTSSKAAKMESRTRSEHELDGGNNMMDIRMVNTQSADLMAAHHHHHWSSTMPAANTTQRLMKENGGDIRDGMLIVPTTTSIIASSAAARGTLSEEDLMSKSLLQERGGGDSIYKKIINRGTTVASGGGDGVHSAVPSILTASTAYHSQDSVFDSPSRMPSYVRISCTLSGYKNYRNVDLRAAQSPPRQQRITTAKMELAADAMPDIQPPITPIATPSPVSSMPIGKSIVERRLEKFQHPQPIRQAAPTTASGQSKEQQSTASNADGAVHTPTPIKDLISSFNKLTVHDPQTTPVAAANRPRQKPPPVPPKRERLFDNMEKEQDVATISLVRDDDLKEWLPTNQDKIQNGKQLQQEKTTLFAPVENGELSNGVSTLEENEWTINGAFHQKRERNEENVTNTMAYEETERAVQHVSASQHPLKTTENGSMHNDHHICESSTFIMSKQTPAIDDYQAGGSLVELEEITTSSTNNGDGGKVISNVDDFVSDLFDAMKMTLDGRYYELQAAKERQRLEAMCAEAEVDLNRTDIPDEAAERVRMAVGRVRLFLGKKFAKFEELIRNNLNPPADDPRPTHVSDLEGYYELVKMEIGDIDACFEIVRRLKENDWKIEEDMDQSDQPKHVHRGPLAQSTVSKSRLPPQQQPKKEVNNARSEAAKQRLKEAKEAAMLRKKQAEESNEGTNDLNLS